MKNNHVPVMLKEVLSFIPKNKKKTFGEMNSSQKYKMDHRYNAFRKIKKFL